MKKYKGIERRKHSRLDANFVVSYRVKEPPSSFDLSQTKNISQGGLLLTTNKEFKKGTFLAMTIRFPFIAEKLEVLGQVISSEEKVRDLIYETHIKFTESDELFLRKIGEYIKENFLDG